MSSGRNDPHLCNTSFDMEEMVPVGTTVVRVEHREEGEYYGGTNARVSALGRRSPFGDHLSPFSAPASREVLGQSGRGEAEDPLGWLSNTKEGSHTTHDGFAALPDDVLRNILDFAGGGRRFEKDPTEGGFLRYRAVNQQFNRVVTRPGNFTTVPAQYQRLARKKQYWSEDRSYFLCDMSIATIFIILISGILFGLPFLGELDGTYRKEQLGTILFIVIAIPLIILMPLAGIIAQVDSSRSDSSLAASPCIVLFTIVLFAFSVPTFHFLATYSELADLNKAEGVIAECPPPWTTEDDYPIFVKFMQPDKWIVGDALRYEYRNTGKGAKRQRRWFRWAVYNGTIGELFQVADAGKCGPNVTGRSWLETRAFRSLMRGDEMLDSRSDDEQWLALANATNFSFWQNGDVVLNERWNVSRMAIDVDLGATNPVTTKPGRDQNMSVHATYIVIHHSDSTISHGERSNEYSKYSRSDVYRRLRLPLLTGTGRYNTEEPEERYNLVFALFIVAMAIMWVIYIAFNCKIFSDLTSYVREMRSALIGFGDIPSATSRRDGYRHEWLAWLSGNRWPSADDGGSSDSDDTISVTSMTTLMSSEGDDGRPTARDDGDADLPPAEEAWDEWAPSETSIANIADDDEKASSKSGSTGPSSGDSPEFGGSVDALPV